MRYLAVLLALVGAPVCALAADYTRDSGTADWMCCDDRACSSIVSQHADEVRAFKACEKLTDVDGKTRYTRSNAFRVTKVVVTSGAASLSWTAPTKNTDGTPAQVMAYRIHYGLKPTELIQAVQIGPVTSHTITDLAPGTYYFAVRAISSAAESDLSNVASKAVI